MPTEMIFRLPGKEHLGVEITLKRTTRVPDDGKEHFLPADLGGFEYFSHKEKKDEKIVPIGNEEALWFNFRSLKTDPDLPELPWAVKILAGGINALTGESEEDEKRCMLKNSDSDSRSGQNYMPVPGQPWLDGFKAKDEGVVRQFVAVELGEGRSVEEKVENGRKHGGVQIIVIPPTPEVIAIAEEEARRRKAERAKERIKVRNLSKRGINLSGPNLSGIEVDEIENLSSMGLGAGGKIKQQIVKGEYPAHVFDTAQAQYLNLTLVSEKNFPSYTSKVIVPTYEEYNNAGFPWFEYNVPADAAVKVDADSRLVKLDRLGKLSALPAEPPPETKVSPDQIVVLKAADSAQQLENKKKLKPEVPDLEGSGLKEEEEEWLKLVSIPLDPYQEVINLSQKKLTNLSGKYEGLFKSGEKSAVGAVASVAEEEVPVPPPQNKFQI